MGVVLDSPAATVSGTEHRVSARAGGVAGNARLTAIVAVALLALLAAEGVTIPFIGKWLGPHMFIGLLLVPPVAISDRPRELAVE